MVRRGFKILAWLTVAGLLFLGAGILWLVGTTSGTEWLLARVNRLEGVQIEARVDGSLWGGLDLKDVRVHWPGGNAEVAYLLLAWRPQALFSRRLSVDALDIGATRIVWQSPASSPASPPTPPSPPPASQLWPKLPAWLQWTAADMESFSLAELSLGSTAVESLVLKDIRGSLHFENGRLRVEELHVLLPCGSWDGQLGLDLARHRVGADLLWRGNLHVADWDGVHSVVDLDENLLGTLRAEALAGPVERLSLAADAALTLSGVELTEFAAQHSKGKDRVAGSVQIDWGEAFRLAGDLRLEHLNLVGEAGWPTDVSGTVKAELNTHGYSGDVDLESYRPGLERGKLIAKVTGDWDGLSLTDFWAGWLGGEVLGDLVLNWHEGFRLSGELQGTDLNPENLVPEMPGRLQLTASGGLQVSPSGELSAVWDAELDRSRLQQRPIEGRVAGHWQQHDLVIDKLDLRGDGLHVQGQGRLSRRIDLQLEVDDLARLGKTWQGALAGEGWLARQGGQWVGAGHGRVEDIHFGKVRAGKGNFQIDYPGAEVESRLDLTLKQLTLPQGTLDEVDLRAAGRINDHEIELQVAWPSGTLAGLFSGSLLESTWVGEIRQLSGREDLIGAWRVTSPAALELGRHQVALQHLQLVGDQGGLIVLTADLMPDPLAGSVQLSWQDFPLKFFDPWLGGPSLTGAASGDLQLDFFPDGTLDAGGEVFGAPVVHWLGHELALEPSHGNLSWDAKGLVAAGEVRLARGGIIHLNLQSDDPGRTTRPQNLTLALAWEKIDLHQLGPWLPADISLDGRWQGDLSGSWRAGATPQLRGKTWIEAGGVQWQGEDGIISLALRQAELSGAWQEGWLDGTLQIVLDEHGSISGRFRLPIAHFDPAAPLDAEASFDVEELGLLMMLMPGVANESHGALKGDLRLAGSWDRPQLFGKVAMRGASADVPALGLKLREAEFDASFNKESMTLERMQLNSGDGRLKGSGELSLAGWRPQRWSLNLQGENVRLVHLPEITLEANPDLQLSGTPDLLTVRGEVTVPTLLINQVPKTGMVEPSEDVILVDTPPEQPVRLFERLDVKLQLNLGNKVLVKAKGLDARLEGQVEVATDKRGAFVGRGEIRVAKVGLGKNEIAQGHYSAYGLKLPIVRGRAIFGGGAIQEPILDVLAERTVGEVKAGVQVTGTARKPVVKLVSDPALPETEILSYIVLGRPLGTSGGQNDSLMLAASALLSQGESAALQEKIKRQLGIDVLEVQSGGGEGVEGSMVAVGKYLTPDLYLSFGQSLFTPTSVAKLRYQIGKHLELESQVGTISGADLSYRLEFH